MNSIRSTADAANLLATTAITEGRKHEAFCIEREKINDERHKENYAALKEIQVTIGRIGWKILWSAIGICGVLLAWIVSQSVHLHITTS